MHAHNHQPPTRPTTKTPPPPNRLADRQRAVVLTIHQPSIEVYQLFDRLTLLAQGRMAYHGPADGALHYAAWPSS